MQTVENVIAFCRENERVCPKPQLWNALYAMLPNKQRVGEGWEPPLPLILAAWHDSSDAAKRLCLANHIEWAEKQGCLDTVAKFLRSLTEKEWHRSCATDWK